MACCFICTVISKQGFSFWKWCRGWIAFCRQRQCRLALPMWRPKVWIWLYNFVQLPKNWALKRWGKLLTPGSKPWVGIQLLQCALEMTPRGQVCWFSVVPLWERSATNYNNRNERISGKGYKQKRGRNIIVTRLLPVESVSQHFLQMLLAESHTFLQISSLSKTLRQ